MTHKKDVMCVAEFVAREKDVLKKDVNSHGCGLISLEAGGSGSSSWRQHWS